MRRRVSASARHESITASRVSSFGVTGNITIWLGATFGGMTTPSSSPCAMISVPIRRVDTPHDVVQACCRVLSRPRNEMSCAFAKFCPRKCDVPAWMAFMSCTIASTVSVFTAPGNRSFSDFSPATTGMASQSRRNDAYTPCINFVSAMASSAVSCAVWPSCQRNSEVRRNKRGRISQRITLAHWLINNGKSR